MEGVDMFGIGSRSALRWTATLALSTTALVGVSAQPAGAATSSAHADAWSSTTAVQWFPVPPNANLTGAPDSLCASTSGSPGGSDAFFTFPAFSIAAGDVIKGVEVKPKYRTNNDHFIQLTDGGAITGSQKSLPLNFPGTSTCDSTSIVTIGGPTDLWGRTFTPADFNGGNIGVRVLEKIGGASDPGNSIPINMDSIELIVHHGPENSPPTADAGGPYTVPEGGSVALDGTGSSDPDGDSLTYSWDLDNDGTFGDATGATPNFSAAGRDGPDSQTIALKVNDGTVDSTADTATVTITNVAPVIESVNVIPASIDEGQSVTVSGTFLDPAALQETHTGTATWSDGVSTPLTVGDDSFSTSRTFPDDHPATGTASDTFTVDITIDDGDGGSDTATSPTVTVNNVAPSIGSISLSAASIDEGDSVTVSGTFTDPALGESTETFSGTALWSDGASTAVTVGAGTFSTSRTFLDDDPTGTPSDTFTVDIAITDDDTGSDTATSPTLTVNNVDPVITALASDATFADKAEEGELVTVTGSFTDVGVLDTHTATIDWGDGTTTAATIDQLAGTFNGDHAYTSGGIYTITVTLTDDDTGSTSDTTSAVVTGVGLNGGVLQVVGTNGDDHVHVKSVNDEIDVAASFTDPKHRRFDAADVTSVEVWLCDGDDHGNVHQSIELPTTIEGGDGNDMLWGGDGPDTINGGDGDDKIWGRDGINVIDGGAGDNTIFD